MRKTLARRAPSRVPASPRRKWAFRLAALGFLLLALVLAEAGLRLFGYGAPIGFLVRDENYYYPNDRFARQFFGKANTSRPVYFRVPVRKSPGVIRILVLGESAAMGTPDPAFSFGRMLELMLQRRFPGKPVELVNAAMRGIDSHVVRRIARDCNQLEPDVLLIYMGNNEVIGLHGPEPGCARLSQSLWFMRTAQFCKSTRLGQLLRNTLSQKKEPAAQDMEFFRKHRLRADDWRRETVRKNFAANLEDICRAGLISGAAVLLSTVPVNMKDFPPLGSLHGENFAAVEEWNTALVRGDYEKAASLDERFAETQFGLGRAFLLAGETNKARQHYQRSLDYDALQFRADTLLNDRIKTVVARVGKVELVDAVSALAENDGGIPGAKFFRDHVHPTFEGDYLLARTFLPKVEAAASAKLGKATGEIPSPQECANLLAYTEWHDAQIQAAMADLTSRPPYHDQLDYRERQARAEQLARERLASLRAPEVERALVTSLAAVKQRPEDWMLRHNCAQLCQAMGRSAGAIEHLDVITKMFPEASQFRILLGQALAQEGRIDAAIMEFEAAARLDPRDERAGAALEQLRKRKR